jgi:hypothetical protein
MREKNQYGENFIICDKCLSSHIQNCGSCFGWGFYSDGRLVNASKVHDIELAEPKVDYARIKENFNPCPECGSDIRGAVVAA